MSQKIIYILALTTIVTAFPFTPIEEIHKPLPYSFGYKIKDKHGEQHREETGDGVGFVKGSYGFTDERGIHRQVHYVADKAGFRAVVKTNEHGTAPLDPAHVKMISSAHPYLGRAGAKVFRSPAMASLEASQHIGAGLVVESPVHFGKAELAGMQASENAVDVEVKSPFIEEPFAIGELPLAGLAAYSESLLGGTVTGYDSRFES